MKQKNSSFIKLTASLQLHMTTSGSSSLQLLKILATFLDLASHPLFVWPNLHPKNDDLYEDKLESFQNHTKSSYII